VLFGYGPTILANASSESANAYPAILASSLALVLLVKAPDGLSGLFKQAKSNLGKLPSEVTTGVFRGYPLHASSPQSSARSSNGSDESPLLTEDLPRMEKVGAR
jgi:hypothetical protein